MDIAIKHFENAKASIIAETQQKIALVKEQAKHEVQPKFQEVEQLKAEKLNQLTVDYNNNRNAIIDCQNKQLLALQENFEKDKKAVCDMAETKKNEILNTTIEAATYEDKKQCDQAVADLDNLIAKLSKKE